MEALSPCPAEQRVRLRSKVTSLGWQAMHGPLCGSWVTFGLLQGFFALKDQACLREGRKLKLVGGTLFPSSPRKRVVPAGVKKPCCHA